ncbi:MAG: winged helix-turn-helix transcriptional regulator [Candidatus Zixiibacteriota bacterium]|nr:MAG: winged helix-turn-helix transcriptional regulator [candidate division Zixibacteria bacterium]
MDQAQKELFEARARIIKAMAHPTRLFIVDELSRQARCVNELTGLVGSDTSTVSKHLSILKNAGLVKDEKKGTQVFYSLKTPCILNFFGCVETVLKTAADESRALVNRG